MYCATSSQPSPSISRCERPGNSTNSVVADTSRYLWKFSFATAGGTVWSCSPTVISSGARSSRSKSTSVSPCSVKFAKPSWKKMRPVSGTA